MTHQSATATLKFASAIVFVTGFAMFLSLFTGLDHVMRYLLDLVYLPWDGGPGHGSPEGRVLTAISGGVMAGWGVMSWFVVTHIYARDPGNGGRILLLSYVTWFVVDGAGSAVAGAWFNIVMNTGFLALFAVPVVLARSKARARPA